jgi:hypothetical protein
MSRDAANKTPAEMLADEGYAGIVPDEDGNLVQLVPRVSGPNRRRVGFHSNGDIVELAPCCECGDVVTVTVLCGWKKLALMREECLEKLWYARRRDRVQGMQGEESKHARQTAELIERKYGKKNLTFDDFGLGFISGQLAVLNDALCVNGHQGGGT